MTSQLNFQVPAIRRAAQEWAISCFPNEAGGFVYDGSFHPVENIAEEPLCRYRPAMKPDHPVDGFIHSHTQDPSTAPSRVDMASQQAAGVPYGIVATDGKVASEIQWFGDQLPVPPLLGRPFVSGVSDCWCLVRDVYRTQFGITLHNVPRDPNWYKAEMPHGSPQDLFSVARIIESGFEIVQLKDAQPGDIVAGRVMCPVVNHCGLLLENNLLLHQLDGDGRISRREPIRRWRALISHVARHKSFIDSPESRPEIRIV